MRVRDILAILALATLLLVLSAAILMTVLKYLPLLVAVAVTLIALSIIVWFVWGTLAAFVGMVAGLYYALRPKREEEVVRPVRLEEAREPDRGEGEG